MCGIVGVVGKIDAKARTAFRQLLIVDSLRGMDSTGFVTAKGANSTVFKRAGDPYLVMDSKAFDKVLLTPSNVLIGHNRAATVGAVNAANAHPFEFPTVVGVHNGTLRGRWRLPDNRMFDVDSENIYHAFDKNGVAATVPILDGAYSLVWWNKVDRTINFLRNSERPMCYVFTKDKKTLFFASEPGMLHWILTRNGIEIEQIQITKEDEHMVLAVKEEFEAGGTVLNDFVTTTIKGYEGVFPKVGVLRGASAPAANTRDRTPAVGTKLVFYPDHITKDTTGNSYVLCDVEGEVLYSAIISVQGDKNTEDWLMDAPNSTAFQGVVKSVSYIRGNGYALIDKRTLVELEDAPEADIIPFDEDSPIEYVGFKGRDLTEGEFRHKTGAGCCICGEVVGYTARDILSIHWVSEDNHVCAACHSDVDTMHYLNHLIR